MSLGSFAIRTQTLEPVPEAPIRKKALVVDDSETILHAICSLLEHHDVVEVTGRAESGTQAIDAALELKPDLVVMDADMPGMSGLRQADVKPVTFVAKFKLRIARCDRRDRHSESNRSWRRCGGRRRSYTETRPCRSDS